MKTIVCAVAIMTLGLVSAETACSQSISQSSLRGHIRFLADDLLEGRGPGTRGDAIARTYIQTQFQTLGLRPGFGADETADWSQTVDLVGVQTDAPETIEFATADQTITLGDHTDMVSVIGRPSNSASVRDAQLVFVGYGIVAPQYDWDDYGDADLRGKVLVMLNNDPVGTEDEPDLFEGNRRLYYGRWDYKYEMAAARGAAGAIILHTDASAGYPWQVIQTSWSGTEFDLASDDSPTMSWEAWSTMPAMRKVFAAARQDLDQCIEAAQSRSFRPIAIDAKVSIELTGELTKTQTANVAAVLPGSDAELRDQHVVVMAHHDHLGIGDRDQTGDGIYNGAVDNASGVAALLSMAAAMSGDQPPRRSVMFVSVGAEEQGLLGSKVFAADPPVPPGRLAAVINIDGINTLGRTRDINVIGYGKSSLDNVVAKIAKSQSRYVSPDAFPDRGYFYRSDQFSLAKIGVPAVYLHTGTDVRDRPPGWGKRQLEQWTETIYHQPSDQYDPDWNLAGAVEDTELLMKVVKEVANADQMPTWNPGDEFEAVRLRSLQTAAARP